MDKKISLILSGGGARGAFHLGVLHALDTAQFEVMEISATSIGSIVGAGYLSGISPKEMLETFCSKRFKQAVKFGFKNGILQFDLDAPIMDELTKGYKNLEDLPKPLHVSITNLHEGRVEYKSSGNIKQIIATASSILPLFSPIKIGEDFYADGGFMDNLPIKPIINSPYPIIGVNVHPNVSPTKYNFFANLKRAMFLSWYSGICENVDKCAYYIAPKEVTNFPVLRTSRLRELFELGVENGEKFAKEYTLT